MPLTKMTSFTKLISNLADKPNMSATDLKAYFDSSPEELRVALNGLIDVLSSTTMDSGAKNIKASTITGLTGSDVQTLLEALKTLVDTKTNTTDVFSKNDLQSVTDTNSGADKIKATPISTSPDTVQGILEWLKSQIDTVVLGNIPDGSVTEQKLSFNPATQSELDSHTGNTTVHITSSERTSWNGKIDGTQKGAANGVASLGSDGKVPSTQLPVANGMTLIASQTLASQAAVITFTNIPQTYKALKVVFSGKTNDGANVGVPLSLTLNNDQISGNYEYMYIHNDPVNGDSSIARVATVEIASAILLGQVDTLSSQQANRWSRGEIDIYDYTHTQKPTGVMSKIQSLTAGGTATPRLFLGSAIHVPLVAVSRLDLYTSGGNFVVDTTVHLYGIN